MTKYSTAYKNNFNLKRVGVAIPFTQEQVDEYIRCSMDCEYFIENYVKIVHIDFGVVPFHMYAYQKKMVNAFVHNRFVITKMPRQSGKSTTVTSYILWCILFRPNQNIAILANKGKLANDLLEKIKLAYENLPLWLQQGVASWNRGSIELENGSKVVAAATSSSAIRGGSFNMILLDEFAFVQPNIAEEFFASVYPTISSGKTSQIIIVSTPRGLNHYYKMWMDAVEKRSDYIPIDVHWSETPGRDEKWKEQTIRNTSELQFRQEFETDFLGSADTLISPMKLRNLAWVTPMKNGWGVDIYEAPIKDHIYTITVDTSHGVALDASAFSVIDITSLPYKLVAKFKDHNTSPMMYPEIIAKTGWDYNTAFVLCETNDVGMVVAESLHRDLEYENILTTITKGRQGQRVGGGFGTAKPMMGVKMTKSVKHVGCANIKDVIEGDKLLIQDYDIIQELSTFIAKGSSYEADDGCHDDLVMSLVLFGWLVRQQMFKDISNNDVRLKLAQERYADVYEDLMPAGFIDTGMGDEYIESIDPHGGGFVDPFKI